MEPNKKNLIASQGEESNDNSDSFGCGSIILVILMLIAAGFVFSIIGKLVTLGAILPSVFLSLF